MALAAETPPRGYPVKENNDAHCVVVGIIQQFQKVNKFPES